MPPAGPGVLAPALPARLEEWAGPAALENAPGALEGVHIRGAVLVGQELDEWQLYGCVLENCRLLQCSLRGARFTDVVLKNCDLTGTSLRDSYFARCEWRQVKAEGADVSGARLYHLAAQGCTLTGANLDGASIERAVFAGCGMAECWLTACKLRHTAFEDTDLRAASFFHTPLKGLDFTTCRFEGVTLSDDAREVRGAVVNLEQAAGLARLLGVVVR